MDFTAGNPSLVAEGFGLTAIRAESGEELESALQEAFSTNCPVFIDAFTEPEVEKLPPVYSWLKAAGEI